MIKIDLKETESATSDWSEVFDYREDLEKLKEQVSKIAPQAKNVISVGNGGSITSFDAYLHALAHQKDGVSVWTMDPFFLKRVKATFSPEDTIVLAVS